MSPTIDTNINGVLSWMTAAWILRLCDEPLRVTTLQPGDGQYDALALLRGSAAPAILMNRSGASALVEGRVVEDIWEVASGRSGTGPRELALLLLSESGIAADLAEIPDTYALSIAQIATAMNFYREVNKRPRRVDCREIPADALTSWVDPPLPPDLANAASEHPAVIDGQREGSWIWQLLRDGDVIAYCDTFTNTMHYVAPTKIQPAPLYTDEYGIPSPPVAAALVSDRTGKTEAIEPLAFAFGVRRHWGPDWEGSIKPLFEVPAEWDWTFQREDLSEEELRNYLD